jgi:hypothetical protein
MSSRGYYIPGVKMNFLSIDWKEPEQGPTKVESASELKELIVSYVGNKLQPENEDVTVEMIVDVFSKEFPEFVLVLASENWLLGYEQGLEDSESLPVKSLTEEST